MLNALLKAKYSFISALVFFIVANPETYKFMQTLLGGISEDTENNKVDLIH